MSEYINISLTLLISLCGIVLVSATEQAPSQSWSLCRLLEHKLSTSNPWSMYPIVFEPISRGRLTIWTGSSNLPISEFVCNPDRNNMRDIILNYANYVNKLEWTFFDMNKGVTYHGFSVNQCEDSKFKLSIRHGHLDSYLNCNSVGDVALINLNETADAVKSICPDCGQSLLPLIDAQVKELFKTRLNEQILDNLYWHVTQLVTSQHFTSPISLDSDLD